MERTIDRHGGPSSSKGYRCEMVTVWLGFALKPLCQVEEKVVVWMTYNRDVSYLLHPYTTLTMDINIGCKAASTDSPHSIVFLVRTGSETSKCSQKKG